MVAGNSVAEEGDEVTEGVGSSIVTVPENR